MNVNAKFINAVTNLKDKGIFLQPSDTCMDSLQFIKRHAKAKQNNIETRFNQYDPKFDDEFWFWWM